MRSLALACLALGAAASPVRADFVTVNAFNDSTPATVSFNDGAGDSGTVSTLLTQWNVTLSGVAAPLTFNTYSIDLTHAVGVGQSYAVSPRNDLSTAFANGARMAYVYRTYGLADLTNNPDQAAAVQIALWDLSLNNHNPTSFTAGSDGSYSSGDPDVFKVSLGSNPDKAQIAGLVNQYLGASVGASGPGGWLDAAVTGAGPDHGPSLILPVPAPPSLSLGVAAAGCLGAWGLRRRGAGCRSYGLPGGTPFAAPEA
jgi:hypothetical protein